MIDDDCHSHIIENITARAHLDYDEYFSSTEEENNYDYASEEEDDI